MFLIEKFSHNIASSISAVLGLDNEQTEIIAYGAYGLIQIIWSFFLMVLFGTLFGLLWEIIIISTTAATLRKFSGGAHATSPNRCAIIGVILFGTLTLLVDRLIMPYSSNVLVQASGLLSFVLVYSIIYKYCPVDNPNKPIKKAEARKRLRKSAFITIHISLFIYVVLIVMHYYLGSMSALKAAYCICVGIIWQSITLTALGHLITQWLDDFLKYSMTFIGGG